MKKPENIYVSLQLSKDVSSRELVLQIQFDQNAPNFFTNKGTISWCPTIEELDFVSEAFGMLSKRKHQGYHQTEESEEDSSSHELIREANEKEILDRVLEKKKPSYNLE
jgi:hypothetical protein